MIKSKSGDVVPLDGVRDDGPSAEVPVLQGRVLPGGGGVKKLRRQATN